MEDHVNVVRVVAYSSDGEQLVSGGDDCTVRIWNASTDQAIAVLHDQAVIKSVAFFPDGKNFVSGAENGTIRSWSVDSAVAPLSQGNLPPLNVLARAHHWHHDGWLVGSSEERLFWVPQEYRPNIVTSGESTSLIANYKIVLSADTALHHGKEWTECWSGGKSSVTAPSS